MKKYIVLVLTVSFIFSACNDWLIETPKSRKSLGGTTVEDARSSVNGIYAFLRTPYHKFNYADVPFSILLLPTGQYKSVAIDDPDAVQVSKLIYKRTNFHFPKWWNSCYGGIQAANIAINSIPDISDPALTDNLRSQLLGEAHFLRAYYYFMLVRLFGDIPMVLKTTTSIQDGQIGKSSVKDIYEKIIVPDLQFAEKQKLPATSVAGRVSMGAVHSLFAKVYLTMAGYPLQEEDKYTLAKKEAGEVIDSGSYSLFQSGGGLSWFDKLNNSEYDNKGENIFMVQYALNLVDQKFSAWFVPPDAAGKLIASNIGFGGVQPTDNFYNSYADNDLRGQNRGFFFDEYNEFQFQRSVYKYFDKGLLQVGPQSGKNIPLLRYADVLLTYAEAQNAADGSPNAKAYEAVNAIRERAGLKAVSGLTKEQFQKEIWKQRYWELTCEGKVWFDMKRTRKAFNGQDFVDLIGFTLPNGKTIQQENLYFLIPQSEIDVDPNLEE